MKLCYCDKMKLVCCAVVLALAAAVQGQFDAQEEAGPFPDYWQSGYDNFYDYPEEINDGAVDSKENIQVKQKDTDKLVEAEIQDFRDQNEAQNDPDGDDDGFDALADYQFEDNRSDTDDKEEVKNDENIPDEEPMPDDAPELNPDDLPALPEPSEHKVLEEDNENAEIAMDDDIWSDAFEPLEEIAPLPVPTDIKESSEKEEVVADQNDDNLDEKSAEKPIDGEKSIKQMYEEANKILEETANELNVDDYAENSDEDDNSFEELLADNNENDETPERVLEDLNSDLNKLFDTLDKLSSNDSDLGAKDENADNNDGVNEVQDYEEKYNRPYKEGNILSLRDDYDNFDDSNLPDIFAENSENDTSKEDQPAQGKDIAGQENVAVDENNDEATTAKVVQAADSAKESDEESFEYSDDLEKLFDASIGNDEEIDDLLEKILRHSYGNDGLVDDQHALNEDAELITSTTTTPAPTTETEEPRSTVMVENLNSEEYNDLMSQFAMTHSEDLDVNSDDFVKNVAPIHITLSVDEPTVITSPNYPSAYPTNNIVDWIIEGPGTGIEMNVTDFYVNGAMGDYLLVKPGGIDASGTDGLIFSFRLNHERKYRFTNVNRMFVRFEAKVGMQFATGFSISARMIWPLPEIGREEIPEAEPVLHPPTESMILSLAGLTLNKFNEVKSSFKELVADMAQEYITDNKIDEGMNTTLEVTQIIKTAVCNIRWPNYETCVEVTFGVPLHYEEEVEEPRLNAEDLESMWRTYIVKEPYAARLREMGITEYAIPDDRTVFMLWLVIALGVVISMAMLAFALWRFSCFEDYTRMMAYSDTDSIHKEKKNLDLYPTPHQTLPPLYSDSDYKWVDDKYDDSTRVDMGGFANKSYVRDDLFEFDSDEDIVTPRDRKDVISPRDVYEV